MGLSEVDTQSYLDDLSLRYDHNGIFVVCVNSSRSITVSGDPNQIDALKTVLDEQQIFARKLQVDVAYHSPYMHGITIKCLAQIQGLELGEGLSGDFFMISSVTGKKICLADISQPEYLVRNMISSVRFSQAFARLCGQEANMTKKLECSHLRTIQVHDLIEIGPHSALQGPIEDILKETKNPQISYILSVFETCLRRALCFR